MRVTTGKPLECGGCNVVVVNHYTLRDNATEIFEVLFNLSMQVHSSLAPFSPLASFARVVHLLPCSAFVTVLRQIAQHTMCTFSKVRHSLTPLSTLGHASQSYLNYSTVIFELLLFSMGFLS